MISPRGSFSPPRQPGLEASWLLWCVSSGEGNGAALHSIVCVCLAGLLFSLPLNEHDGLGLLSRCGATASLRFCGPCCLFHGIGCEQAGP